MGQYKFKCPICGKWNDIIPNTSETDESDIISWIAGCSNEPLHNMWFDMSLLPDLLQTLRSLGIQVADVARVNIAKLEDRRQRDAISGEGDDR